MTPVKETKEGNKYRAILARGEAVDTVPPTLNHNDTNNIGSGQVDGTQQSCPTSADDGTLAL